MVNYVLLSERGDMVTEMEFTVPAGEFPLGSIFESMPEVTVELERLVPQGSRTIPYVWVRGTEAESIELEFESHPGVTDIRLIDNVDDEHLMRAQWVREYDGLLAALSEADLTVLSGVGTADGWRFEVRGDAKEAIGEFRTRQQEYDIPVDISTIHALDPIRGDSYELTETQREALVLAHEEGYFDTPRQASLEDLATELGITQQSLSSRLRRGHRRLIDKTLIVS